MKINKEFILRLVMVYVAFYIAVNPTLVNGFARIGWSWGLLIVGFSAVYILLERPVYPKQNIIGAIIGNAFRGVFILGMFAFASWSTKRGLWGQNIVTAHDLQTPPHLEWWVGGLLVLITVALIFGGANEKPKNGNGSSGTSSTTP